MKPEIRGQRSEIERNRHVKGDDKMRTNNKTIAGIMTAVALLLAGGGAWAGSLTPPGAPAPTMYTLTEIYDVMDGLQQMVTDMQQELNTIKLRQSASGFVDTVGGMVLIPEGLFWLGDVFSEGSSGEIPVHEVTVSAFYMDQYPVTKALWDAVRTWADIKGIGYTDLPSGGGKGPSHPVHSVNWYVAVQWANARSERDGLTPVYYTTSDFTTVYRAGTGTPHPNWSANGYRLPTEAEWEKAARGGVQGRRFPWADGNTISHMRANYSANTFQNDYDVSATGGYHPDYNEGSEVGQGAPYTSPVGSFAPNGYGLYDMAGNISEWCWDWYSNTYYTSFPRTNPRGPAMGSFRVLRGGNWSVSSFSARCASRGNHHPLFFQEDGINDIGFRCARGL
jgi:formylglycine-generating enzyme required for sulfatase activity